MKVDAGAHINMRGYMCLVMMWYFWRGMEQNKNSFCVYKDVKEKILYKIQYTMLSYFQTTYLGI